MGGERRENAVRAEGQREEVVDTIMTKTRVSNGQDVEGLEIGLEHMYVHPMDFSSSSPSATSRPLARRPNLSDAAGFQLYLY